MNHDAVLPALFLGSCPRDPADVSRLVDECSVTAVVNLQTDDDFRALGVDWLALEAAYAARRVVVCRTPVRDFDADALREWLPSCVRALTRLLSEGHVVYLHCTAGAGRSPAVAIAYLHWCEGWDLGRAAAHVVRRRPSSPNLDAVRLATQDLLDGPGVRAAVKLLAHLHFKRRALDAGTAREDWVRAEREVLKELLRQET